MQYIGKYWEFARGHIDHGESKKQTARREIWEETGLAEFKFVKDFEIRSAWKYEHDGILVDKKVYLFLAESADKKGKISHEHIGYAWLPAKEALRKITFDNSKQAFKEALGFLEIKCK